MRLDQIDGRLLTVTRRRQYLTEELRSLRREQIRLVALQDVVAQFPELAAEDTGATAEVSGADQSTVKPLSLHPGDRQSRTL